MTRERKWCLGYHSTSINKLYNLINKMLVMSIYIIVDENKVRASETTIKSDKVFVPIEFAMQYESYVEWFKINHLCRLIV